MKQFEGYEEYLKQSELSKQTRQVYLREAEKFVRYLNRGWKRGNNYCNNNRRNPESWRDQSCCKRGNQCRQYFI